MNTPTNKLFGRLAVEQGFLKDDQIEDALQIQKVLTLQGRPLALGSILKNLGYLGAEQLDTLLSMQKDETRSDMFRREAALFGQLAIENGFTTTEEVEEALRIQNEAPLSFKIGSIMVSRSVITDDQRGWLLKAMERMVRDSRSDSARSELLGTEPKEPFGGLFSED